MSPEIVRLIVAATGETLFMVAVAAGIGQMFRGQQLCEGFSPRDLWTHCLSVGVTARELARQQHLPIADEAFLAGMIHDIGLLVSLQTDPEKLRTVCERAKVEDRAFCEIEREVCGVDHQELGQALAELWKFPRACQLVAGFHHRPGQLADNSRPLVMLVSIADTLCCNEKHGFYLTANRQVMDVDASDLGLEPALIERVRAAVPALIAEASGVFAG